MPLAKAIKDLFDWKEAFLKAQIKDIDNHINRNNASIRRLRRMPDTEQQIESLEHQNEGLEEDKKPIQDELDRFRKGSEGKKINMARRNLKNEIHRLQKQAVDNKAAAAAALAAAGPLIDLDNAADEALRQ